MADATIVLLFGCGVVMTVSFTVMIVKMTYDIVTGNF